MFISKGYVNFLTGGFSLILLKRIITFCFMHILSVLTSQNGTLLWVFRAQMVQFQQVPPTCLQSPLPLTSLPPIIPTLTWVIIEQSPGEL